MIKVCSLRNNRLLSEEWQVRVDRASVLGNPFIMRDESERDAVCDEYQVYFDAIVNNKLSVLKNYCVSSKEREEFMNELRRLYKLLRKYNTLELYCWCAPKRCHAETIKNFLEKYI